MRRIMSLIFSVRALLSIAFMVAAIAGFNLDRANAADETPTPEVPSAATPTPTVEPTPDQSAEPEPVPTPVPTVDPGPAPCSGDAGSVSSVPELGCSVYVRLPADDLSYLRKAGSAAVAALGVMTLALLTLAIGSFRR